MDSWISSHLHGHSYTTLSLPAGKSLDTLPPETLDCITSFLDPFDLARMSETGSAALLRSMCCGGVTRFEWKLEVSGDRRWPKLLRCFSKLRTLIITAPFGVSVRGINLEDLPPTLLHLKFSFNEAESCWYLLDNLSPSMRCLSPVQQIMKSQEPPEMRDVQTLFPNLISLELAGAYHVSNAFVSKVPRTVKTLSVQTIDDLRPIGTPPFFSNEGISELPPELDSLTLSGYLPWTADDSEKLPRSLTSLSLVGVSNLNDSVILNFPALQHLEFSFSKKTKVTLEGLRSLSHLTSLDIKKAENLRADFFQFLPRCMKSLSFGGALIDQKHAQAMPRQLEYLNLTNVSLENGKVIESFPRALRTLILITRNCYTERIGPYLPRTLTHLYLLKPLHSFSWKDEIVGDLPKSLTFLHVSPQAWTNACTPNLPRGLTSLDLGNPTSMDSCCFAQLPRDLTFLNIRHWHITDDSIQYLPRGLLSLSLVHGRFITDAGIAHLPPNLTVLEIREPSITGLTDAAAALLPRTLKSLAIGSAWGLTSEFVRNLPPSITSIDVGHSGTPHPTPTNSPTKTAKMSWWQTFLDWIPVYV